MKNQEELQRQVVVDGWCWHLNRSLQNTASCRGLFEPIPQLMDTVPTTWPLLLSHPVCITPSFHHLQNLCQDQFTLCGGKWLTQTSKQELSVGNGQGTHSATACCPLWVVDEPLTPGPVHGCGSSLSCVTAETLPLCVAMGERATSALCGAELEIHSQTTQCREILASALGT